MKASKRSLCALAAACVAAPALCGATMATRTVINHAAFVCQAATPAFEPMLSASPSGIRNADQQSSAIVVCGGVASPDNNLGDVISWKAVVNNVGNSVATIKCRLDERAEPVSGSRANSYPKTVDVAAGGTELLGWDGADRLPSQRPQGTRYAMPSMTCELPANTEIAYTSILYEVTTRP